MPYETKGIYKMKLWRRILHIQLYLKTNSVHFYVLSKIIYVFGFKIKRLLVTSRSRNIFLADHGHDRRSSRNAIFGWEANVIVALWQKPRYPETEYHCILKEAYRSRIWRKVNWYPRTQNCPHLLIELSILMASTTRNRLCLWPIICWVRSHTSMTGASASSGTGISLVRTWVAGV